MNDIIEQLAPSPAKPDPGWAQATLRRIQRSEVSASGWRRLVAGGFVVGAVTIGGAAAAATSGLFGGVEAVGTTTSDFDLGPAPAGSTYVEVTVDVACRPGSEYGIDLDHADNPAQLLCEKNSGPSQLQYEFELPPGSGPEHTATVSTNVDDTYTFRAHYRSGLTQHQKFQRRLDAEDEARDEAARTVKRTTKVPSSDPYNHPAVWPDPYYVNENGMTIGIYQERTPYDQRPDLVPAQAPNGEPAFTYSDKRNFLVPENPSGAVAYMDWLVETGQTEKPVPGKWSTHYRVYVAEDGKTILARTPSGSSKSE